MNEGKILMIDDDEDVLIAGKMLLKKAGHHVITEKNPEKIPFLLNNDQYDLILLDMNFSQDTTSGKEGFYWLSEIKKSDAQAVVVLMTAFGDVETAVRALKEGATDFILKPWQNEKLLATISSAIRLRHSYYEIDKLRKAKELLEEQINRPFGELIGQHASMQQLFEAIQKVAQTDTPVLLQGEHHTGKELTARTIHQKSRRKNQPFMMLDVQTLSPDEIEKKIWGEKQATGQSTFLATSGCVEMTNGGTFFLKNCQALPIEFFDKIKTSIQTKSVTPVGASQAIPVNVRWIFSIAASNERSPIEIELLTLSPVKIAIPALRERAEDVVLLAHYFLRQLAKQYRKTISTIQPEAVQKLKAYAWHGNIRELQNCIERSVILTEGQTLLEKDIIL